MDRRQLNWREPLNLFRLPKSKEAMHKSLPAHILMMEKHCKFRETISFRRFIEYFLGPALWPKDKPAPGLMIPIAKPEAFQNTTTMLA
jgi:hypothetical protein